MMSREVDGVPLPPSVTAATATPLPRLDVATPLATAQVYSHGAHLAAWQPSHCSAPVLWMSAQSSFRRDKPIRGGVPLCFPWFGPHPTEPGVPAHGFARLSPWTLCEAAESADGTVALTFQLEADNASPVWPHHFHADLRLHIGSTLRMALDVYNLDQVPFTFEEALHTYFTVSRIDDVSVSGLEHTSYLDKVGGQQRRQQTGGPIQFIGETDRLYLDTHSTCVVLDPGLARRITIAKEDSRSTVVWNPWVDKARSMPDFGDDEWGGMLCIETANVGEAAITLRPGDRHTMSAIISVEST